MFSSIRLLFMLTDTYIYRTFFQNLKSSDCKLKDVCENKCIQTIMPIVIAILDKVKKFILKVQNFVIFYLYNTQN